MIEQTILVWIHLIAASIWVGGSLFLGVVLAPLLKTMYTSTEERIRIMIIVGRRFNKFAIPALLILIGTGLYKAYPILKNTDLVFSSDYGNILLIKIIVVIILLIIYGLHIRVIRKKVENDIMSGNMSKLQLQKLRKKIIILGEVVVVLSLVILFLAAVLDSGL
ncbi:MAG: CopD family protein [Candidatus Nitrosoabyssus spongiisocia]|nr:MAG: CopD family protein [Nitrosopumilaceae archaeon AB1(1)]